jgi:hypothetical protein
LREVQLRGIKPSASVCAKLMADQTAMMVFFYRIIKLKTRFLSGDYAEALAAADKAS